MTDPLGRSQVLAYLEKLSSPEFAFSIISYEKEDQFRLYQSQINEICKKSNIDWYPLSYTKSPPIVSTVYDLWQGWRLLKRLARVKSIDILHCRGYITAILGLRGRSRIGAKFIFDMRGFWADEKKESGNWGSWPYQPIYRYFKRLEKQFFKQSDGVVSLTKSGRSFIVQQGWAKDSNVIVIPTCVNFDLFPGFDAIKREEMRSSLDIDSTDVVCIYSGSLGGNYPVEQLLRLLKECKEQIKWDRTIILTNSPHSLLYKSPSYQNYPLKHQLILKSATIEEVHRYLMAADYGILFYKEGFSNLGRSPTKLGEYWACGVELVPGPAVGDVSYYLEKCREKKELSGFDNLTYEEKKILFRKLSEDHFSIYAGVRAYADLYKKITSK